MPRTDWGWEVTPEELASWILWQDDSLLAVNKPPHLVCHPSKHGPWSSLIGACREHLGADRLHMVSRLDRETSGVVVIAKDPDTASLIQSAMESRQVQKTYLAILEGALPCPTVVNGAIGPHPTSAFAARRAVIDNGQPCETEFRPLASTAYYTLAEVVPVTGRMHQIRVHAAHIGHPIVGDKLYGPDEQFMFRFISSGFSPDMLAALKLERHALHAWRIAFPNLMPGKEFIAPLPEELVRFWANQRQETSAIFDIPHFFT